MAALRQFLPEGNTDRITQKLDLVARSYRDIAVQHEMGMKAVMRLLDLDGAGDRDGMPAHDAAPVKKRRKAALLPTPKSPRLICAPVALSAMVMRLSDQRASSNTGAASTLAFVRS